MTSLLPGGAGQDPRARIAAATRAAEDAAERLVRGRWDERDPAVLALLRLTVRAGGLGHAGLDLGRPDAELATLLGLEPGPDGGPAALPPLADRLDALRRSSAVAAGPLPATVAPGAPVRPLVLTGALLQTERAHRYEQRLVAALARRRAAPRPTEVAALELTDRAIGLARAAESPGAAPPGGPSGPGGVRVTAEQLAAVRTLLAEGRRAGLAVLHGGPGTGKTTTVASLLALLAAASAEPPRIALAAPTGRARSRLVEASRGQGEAGGALRAPRGGDDAATAVRDHLLGVPARTVHGLLGMGGDGVPRRPAGGLPHDVVVVDEVSMLDLPLAAELFDAVADGALVILVGDPDQLESVGTGSVLRSLMAGLATRAPVPVAELRTSHRRRRDAAAGGEVAAESARCAAVIEAVRAQRADELLDLLAAQPGEGSAVTPGIRWLQLEDGEDPGRWREDVTAVLVPRLAAARRHARAADPTDPTSAGLGRALDELAGVRLLCAHRRGPWGVETWNGLVREAVAAADEGAAGGPRGGWVVGEPVILTVNDPRRRRSTGDGGGGAAVGPAVRACPRPPAPDAAEAEAASARLLLRPAVALPEVRSAHAITVHRAQGSEYEDVVVVMPPSTSPLATRELLYTALTRARRQVLLVASAASLRAAVGRASTRMGGLASALAALPSAPDAG
ncbi:MAG: AAA family ATPase [Nitriliruptoraceae bacterium]